MKPRERIQAVLDHRAVDRLPVDLWCTPEVVDSLRAYTGLQDEYAVYDALGVDKIAWVFPEYRGRQTVPAGSDGITPWGVPTRTVRSGPASYEEYTGSPLAGYDSPDQLDDYPWPDPGLFDYAGAKALADRARSWEFATIGPWVSHFEIYCQLRGLEDALVDTLVNEDFLAAALDRIEDVQTAVLQRYLVELDDRIDMIFLSDDMGMQDNMLLALESWEDHFKPRVKRWCDLVHGHGRKVLYHSDGACSPIIPGLVECGVDILNPIQHVCPGMELPQLKDRFGDALVFHGGVENQSTLPFGSVDDVVRETRHCLETLGRDGQGYIPCSCHNVQAGTPVENIVAMIETVKTYG